VPPGKPQEVQENPSDGSDQTAGSSSANNDYADLTPDLVAVPPSDPGDPVNPTNLQIVPNDPNDPNAGSPDPSTAFNTPVSDAVVAEQAAQNAADLGVVLSDIPTEESGGSAGQPVPSDAVVADQEAQNARDLGAMLSDIPIDQDPPTDQTGQKPASDDSANSASSTDPKAAGGQDNQDSDQDSDQDSPDASQDSPEPSSNENFSLSLDAAAVLVPDSADQEPIAALDSVFAPENLSPGQEWHPVEGEESAPTGGAESMDGSQEPNDVAANEPSTDYDGASSSFEGSAEGESGFDHSGPAEPEESPSVEPADEN
jgi:hypothetical protein